MLNKFKKKNTICIIGVILINYGSTCIFYFFIILDIKIIHSIISQRVLWIFLLISVSNKVELPGYILHLKFYKLFLFYRETHMYVYKLVWF